VRWNVKRSKKIVWSGHGFGLMKPSGGSRESSVIPCAAEEKTPQHTEAAEVPKKSGGQREFWPSPEIALTLAI